MLYEVITEPGSELRFGSSASLSIGGYSGAPGAVRFVRRYVRSKHPDKRAIDPMEFAAMVVYLACDASLPVTGAALSIDGGWSAS